MLINLLCIIACLYTDSGYKYWEDFSSSERQEVLQSDSVSQASLEYYSGCRTLSDDEETFLLLESLSNYQKEDSVFALYFYELNRIGSSADGALAEVIGKYLMTVIRNHPNYVVNYFNRNSEVRDDYALSIGFELGVGGNGTGIQHQFEEFKSTVMDALDSSLKETWSLFCDTVSEIIRTIEEPATYFTSSRYNPIDISISNRLLLCNPKSVVSSLGEVAEYIYEKDSVFEMCIRHDNQLLTLYTYTKNEVLNVSFFKISYINPSICEMHIDVNWPFYTNTGFRLGMSEDEAISLFHVPYQVIRLENITLYYYEASVPNEFLKNYTFSRYSELLVFLRGVLNTIAFGFDSPYS